VVEDGAPILIYNPYPNLEENGESPRKVTKTTLISSFNLWTVGWVLENLGIQIRYSLQ